MAVSYASGIKIESKLFKELWDTGYVAVGEYNTGVSDVLVSCQHDIKVGLVLCEVEKLDSGNGLRAVEKFARVVGKSSK